MVRRPLPELLRNPAVVLLYFFVAIGVLESPYNTTRYTLFLYPLGLVVLTLSLGEATRWLLSRSTRWAPVRSDAVAAVLQSQYPAAPLVFQTGDDVLRFHLNDIDRDFVLFDIILLV